MLNNPKFSTKLASILSKKLPKNNLYLIPSFIGEYSMEYLPQRTINRIHSINHFIVEREKTARAFLKAIQHPSPQNKFVFSELDKHNNYSGFNSFFDTHIDRVPIGVISEAGLPTIADPGNEIVQYAHLNKVKVIPLAGSSSIFLALMGSGFNGQNFQFNGYLPIDSKARIIALKEMERRSRTSTQIFMEAPYRNNPFLDFLIQHLQDGTKLCIAVDIEKEGKETIISKSVRNWKSNEIDLHKRPCIFLIAG